jgi:hypothetical protein
MARKSVRKARNEIKYAAYPFTGEDPALKLAKELYRQSGMTVTQVKNEGGAGGALYGWLTRDVKRPQFYTLAANLKVVAGIDLLEMIKAKAKAR